MAGSAAHTITLAEDAYALLAREAQRRGIDPDALAGELLRADLAPAQGELESALSGLAGLRDRLGEIDGLALARDARGELDRRVA